MSAATITALAQAEGEPGFRIESRESGIGFVAWADDGRGTTGWDRTAPTEVDARLATLQALIADGHEVRAAVSRRGPGTP